MEIAGYKIHRKIGEGAMAGVFLADQESLGRQVALKVLAPALASQRGFTERFLKEGRIIAYLKHPQIVSVYDLGSQAHHYYLAMEFLSGGTLEQKIKSGLTTAQSVQLIKKISQALSYAHDRGVIHRDIKSQNIMFRNDDIPVLTDFGIARLMDNDPQLTIPGRTMGSPLYMSPEQICGRKIDTRADLYSVGILFYKMLTNKLPYQSDQILTIAMMHKTAPIPELPKDLALFQNVLNTLLAKDPDQRYANAQHLIEALAKIESENAYLRPNVKEEPHHTERTELLSVAEQMNISTIGKVGEPVVAAQPIDESKSMGGDPGQMFPLAETAHDRSDNQSQILNNKPSHMKKGLSVRKVGFVMGGAISALAAGIFAFYYYVTPFAGSSQFLSASLHGDTPNTVQVHRQIPKEKAIPVVVHPQEEQPAVLPAKPKPIQPTEEYKPTPIQPATKYKPIPIQPTTKYKPTPIQSTVKYKPTPIQPTVNQKIEDLMAKAQRQLAKYSLTSPPGDNCYETYQQLLSLDTSGQQAESILKKIGEAYHDLALAAKDSGNLNQSLVHVGKGLALLPKDSILLNMQEDLRMKLAEQNRIMQEQAQRNEQEAITRAAELASMAKRREAERQQEANRRQEVENERLEQMKAEPETTEPQITESRKVKIEPPKSAAEPPNSRKRLFGTF